VRIFLLLSVTPMRDDSGRSRPMRAGFSTGTHRCRSSEEAHSLLGWRVSAYRERWTLPQKTLIILWSIFWALSFVNSNTCHLICNNFKWNFIFSIVCLCVCVCAFSLYRESSDMILGDKPLISEVVLSQAPQHETNPSFIVQNYKNSNIKIIIYKYLHFIMLWIFACMCIPLSVAYTKSSIINSCLE
jgi:hypothetical protein